MSFEGIKNTEKNSRQLETQEIGPYKIRPSISSDHLGDVLELVPQGFAMPIAFVLNPDKFEIYLGRRHKDLVKDFVLDESLDEHGPQGGWVILKKGQMQISADTGTITRISPEEIKRIEPI